MIAILVNYHMDQEDEEDEEDVVNNL